MEKIILKCPPVEMKYSKRIEILKEYVEKWIYSDALLELIQIFGGEFKKSGLLQEDINWLNSFADVWDYRKKQADGGERWNIYDDEFVKEHSPKILQIAECLGLVDNIEPIEIPDYILPLGGAKMSNYDRSVHTKKIVDSSNKPIQNIVSLTGMRPINDIERPYINKYALNSLTEYDVMCAAIEEVFDFSNVPYNQLNNENPNINLSWSVRNYNKLYNNHSKISIIAAPSTDSSRRANSIDTFEFFLKYMNIKQNSKLLLVTNCIYVPFQLMKFMPLALKENLYVECVGSSNNKGNPPINNASNYCQEIKATINAIKFLFDSLNY